MNGSSALPMHVPTKTAQLSSSSYYNETPYQVARRKLDTDNTVDSEILSMLSTDPKV